MIIAIGDIHGEFEEMQSKMVEIMESADEPVNFVQLGDFGLGFERPKRDHDRLTTINYLLQVNHSHLWVIRGNHDNPGFWQWGCGYQFSNIHFVADDSIVKLDDKLCYFAGGAVSIDRSRRIQGIDYWAGEIHNERNLLGFKERIDILFTHDVYHPVSPFGTTSDVLKYWCERDQNLMGDILNSQNSMMSLYHALYDTNPKFSWYHGHYHESHLTINGEQKTHSLGILEFKEVR